MKISVVIPVYKAEKFIGRCLDSLIAQSFTDWEAVCVDDGSPDHSGEILDRYAASDSRIRVIHNENGGVSKARNCALEAITGDYVLFVDADDFLHPQTMEITSTRAEADGSDIVAFTYDRLYHTRLTIRQALHLPDPGHIRFAKYSVPRVEALVTDDIFRYATEYSHPKDLDFDKKWLVKHCQPWRCLYRRETVQPLRFIEGIIYEDFPWWGEVLRRTSKATILKLPLYYYYPSFSSYIHRSSQEYRISSLITALAKAGSLFSDVPSSDPRAQAWEANFLVPFRDKLRKKQEALSKK